MSTPSNINSTAPSGAASTTHQSASASLQKIMQEAAEVLANLVKLDNQTVQNQAQLQQALVQISQNQADQAQKQAQQLAAALDAQSHSSKISSILNDVFGGLLMAVGILTGDPVLFIAAAMMFSMNVSGGTQALNNAVGGSAWAQFGVNLGISIGAALLTAGVAQGVQAAAEEAVPAAGADAAVAAGGAAARNAARDAAEQAAADNGVDPILDGPVMDEADEAPAVNNNAAAAARKLPPTYLQNFEKAFSQMLMAFNPIVPLLQQAFKKAGMSDDQAQMAAELVGTAVAGIGAGIVTGIINSSTSTTSLTTSIQQMLGGLNSTQFSYLTTGAWILTSAFGVGTAGFNIQEGQATLQTAGFQRQQGQMSATQTILQMLMSQLSTFLSAIFAGQQSVGTQQQTLNSNWVNYLAPYEGYQYVGVGA